MSGDTCVDVPFVGEDAEGDVDFDVFYSPLVTDRLPWELIIGLPCQTHTIISHTD